MGYLYGSFYINGGSSCTSANLWFPGQGRAIDYNDGYRNNISNIYLNNFGRYGEFGGVESWLVVYVNNGNHRSYSYMNTLIRNSANGYDITARNGRRHVMIGTGGCPPPIIYGCTDPQADNYNPSATPGNSLSSAGCSYSRPTVSLTASPSSVILEDNQSYTLTWSMSSRSTIFSRQLYVNGSFDRTISSNYGSITLTPSTGTDLSYQLRVSNRGGTSYSNLANVAVYERPTVTLLVDRETIVQGESTILRWSVSGDADTLVITPGIGSSNLVSYQTISPSVTTTYTATATGVGGTGSDELQVTVLPEPSVNVNGPDTADYESDITVSYDATNVPTSFTLTPYYYDLDGNMTIGDPVTLDTGDIVDGTHIFDEIPWGDRGPSIIEFTVNAEGYGELTASDIHVVNVNIDQNPGLVSVPESRDKFKTEEPVISPEEDSLLTLEVTDIDIPVEIKADKQIKVEIDDNGIWNDVRSI